MTLWRVSGCFLIGSISGVSYVLCFVAGVIFFFFFKQKTAYEMRISDWSSDVCSSDLEARVSRRPCARPGGGGDAVREVSAGAGRPAGPPACQAGSQGNPCIGRR